LLQREIKISLNAEMAVTDAATVVQGCRVRFYQPAVCQMRRLIVAAFLVSIAFHVSLPALCADAASPDDTARFLAGMPLGSDSPLIQLTRDASWQEHAKLFDDTWKGLDERQLSNIHAWTAENIADPRPVLFYFFSGPDFLYANAFFPAADTYVLAALEPVGRIPDVARLPRGLLPSTLHHLESSLGNILKLSYFITLDMDSKLRQTQLNGTLPVLYVFLARSGKTIRDVSYVNLKDDGTVEAVTGTGTEKGVKITFSGSDGHVRTLYYFSTNLSNKGVRGSGSFLKFCGGLGTGDAFVKSASYLLHGDEFSEVRNFLLAHSAAILQDDTGVPVSDFKPDLWDLRPYGTYTSPIGMFRHNFQSKLKGLYQNGHPEPINFGVGYKFKVNQSNLLLAVRKDTKADAGQ